jgi:hypothetical protein
LALVRHVFTNTYVKMIDKIKIMVEERLNVDFKRNTRQRDYVYSRAVFFMLVDKYCSISTVKMGKSVGRDHATVLHYRKNVYRHARSEQKYLSAYKYISNIVDKMIEKSSVPDMVYKIKNIEPENERVNRLEALIPMLSEHLNNKAKIILKLQDKIVRIENDFCFEDHEVRFRELSEENKELFRIRANAILNMMK